MPGYLFLENKAIAVGKKIYRSCQSTFNRGIGTPTLRLITVPLTSGRPSRSLTLPSGRPGQLIRARRRSVGAAELALRDHLEPRPPEGGRASKHRSGVGL